MAGGASTKNVAQVQGRFDSKAKQIQEECNKKITVLQSSFEESVKLLLEVYDKYMMDFAPAKEFLPVVIAVEILPKGTLLRNVSVSRTDSLEDIRPTIERRLAEMGDPVSHWGASTYTIAEYVKVPGLTIPPTD